MNGNSLLKVGGCVEDRNMGRIAVGVIIYHSILPQPIIKSQMILPGWHSIPPYLAIMMEIINAISRLRTWSALQRTQGEVRHLPD